MFPREVIMGNRNRGASVTTRLVPTPSGSGRNRAVFALQTGSASKQEGSRPVTTPLSPDHVWKLPTSPSHLAPALAPAFAPAPSISLDDGRHWLNGYLAQRVPSLFLAHSFRMCLHCEVLKGMFAWRARYPLS